MLKKTHTEVSGRGGSVLHDLHPKGKAVQIEDWRTAKELACNRADVCWKFTQLTLHTVTTHGHYMVALVMSGIYT